MTFTKTSGILIVICSMVLVLLFAPTSAVAKKTPTVCDDLSGKAYGLCNAYCEALDCDWNPNASERACEALRSNYSALTGESEFPCETMSFGCVTGDSGENPPSPFDVGDGNDYGGRELGITVPEQCECDPSDSDCTPCPIVAGFHGYGQTLQLEIPSRTKRCGSGLYQPVSNRRRHTDQLFIWSRHELGRSIVPGPGRWLPTGR